MAEIICVEDNTYNFSELDKGIVFKYGGDFYIKTDIFQTPFDEVRNCVSLKTGYHKYIDPYAKVEIFNKLTIEKL